MADVSGLSVQDAGKSIHDMGPTMTFVDLNRTGGEEMADVNYAVAAVGDGHVRIGMHWYVTTLNGRQCFQSRTHGHY